MKLFRLLALLFLLTPVAGLAQNTRYNGKCDNPGLVVVTSGQSSTTKVDRIVPSCQVNVYNTGTIVAATIYSDSGGTPLANPFIANSDGSYSFYTSSGTRVDIVHSGGTSPNNYASPFTVADETIGSSGGITLPVLDTQTLVKGSADATKLLRFEVDGFTSGVTRIGTWPNANITVVGADFANSWSDGIRQVFNPNNSASGLNVGQNASDPTVPVNGDVYYNTTTTKFRCYENGAWANCIGSGATPGSPSLSLQYNNSGVLGGITNVTSNGSVVTFASGSLSAQNIVNTGTLTLPTSTDTLVGKQTIDIFTNKSLLSNTNVLGGVTMQLGSDATGDVYYRAFGGTLTRLGATTNGFVLTLSGGLPTWAIAAASTLTVGTTTIASGTATRLLYETSGNVFGEITGITSNGTTLTVSQAITWSDGVTQTFNPNGTNSGVNVGAHTGDPSSPVNGDTFYNSTTNRFRCYENGSWTNCIGVGSSGLTVGTTPITSGTAGRLFYETAGNVFGEITGATSNGTTVTLASPIATTALVTTSATFALVNTTATTLNFAGAATTINVGTSATILNFGGGATAAEFRFLEPSGSGTNFTAFKAVAQAADVTYSLPPDDGTSGQFLTTDGAGVLTWTTSSGGGMAIGGAVTGGTDSRILFVSGGGLLAQSANLTYNGTDQVNTKVLVLAGSSIAPLQISGDPGVGSGLIQLTNTSAFEDSNIRFNDTGSGQKARFGFANSSSNSGAPFTSNAYWRSVSDDVNFVLGTTSSNTNTAFNFLTLDARSSGSVAASFGSNILWNLESTTTESRNAASQSVFWTTATDASRTSAITFSTVTSAGSLTEVLRLATASIQVSSADLSPITDAAADLGTTTVQWKQLFIDYTITAGGTTGGQTIDKAAGTVNMAAASGTTITVTSNKVSTSSIVFAVARTNDTTCSVKNVVPGGGSFVINLTAACTAETSLGWWILNQ